MTEALAEGLGIMDGEADGFGLTLGDGEGLGLIEGLGLGEGLTDGEGVGVAVSDDEGKTVGLTDGEGFGQVSGQVGQPMLATLVFPVTPMLTLLEALPVTMVVAAWAKPAFITRKVKTKTAVERRVISLKLMCRAAVFIWA